MAEYFALFLRDYGVKHVFGYQGEAVLKQIDAIAATPTFQYVQNYLEQAAAFCVYASVRLSGEFGVTVATFDPGATNLLTGVANTHLDSIPTLF